MRLSRVVLEKCEDNVGILNALGGGELIDVDDILKKTHLEDVRNRAIKAFNEANITYSFPSQIFQELKNASGEMVKSSANFPSTEGLPANPELQEAITNINRTRQNIGKFSKKLEVLVQQISQTINESALSAAFQKDKGIRIIREQFDKIMGRIKNDIIIERDNLLKSAFPCKPLYDLWQKIAAVICVELNTPLQGVWGSAGLIAIFLVPTIALIVPTVKYLFRMKSKYDFHR
ncbi:hypothetical protein AB6A40_002101 [Gnathostoma spinigerum]|uniref:Uncharacterized protein n=1 Tax=Gnathostoma spinigerum TaxID=75299 RepID=A0ABD6EFE4_9BILA